MKITAVKTFLIHVGASHAEHSKPTASYSGNLTGTRNWFFVKIYTDAGVVGIGECSGWPRVVETAVQGKCIGPGFGIVRS